MITELLADHPVSRLEAEVLLARVLKRDRAWLLAHGDEAVTPSVLERFQFLLHRRLSGEPIAYLTGEKEFYGRMFHVDPRVMIPRPSTEALIDEVKRLWRDSRFQIPESKTTKADTGIVILSQMFRSKLKTKNYELETLVDIGTGSGCIAVTLALELPEATIIASDISGEALEVARMNAERHGVLDRIIFVQDSLIPRTNKRINQETFLLVSNPPYLRADRDEHSSTAHEPREALYAGADSLDVLLPLIQQARVHPRCIGVVLECLEWQIERVIEAKPR